MRALESARCTPDRSAQRAASDDMAHFVQHQEDDESAALVDDMLSTTQCRFEQNIEIRCECIQQDPAWRARAIDPDRVVHPRGPAMVLPTASLTYWSREHRLLIESTAALEEWLVHSGVGESPRDWWRLQLLRNWSHVLPEQCVRYAGLPRQRSEAMLHANVDLNLVTARCRVAKVGGRSLSTQGMDIGTHGVNRGPLRQRVRSTQ